MLIDNLWIVSSCWMDYRRRDAASSATQGDWACGFRQVEMLVRPYLTQTWLVTMISGAAASVVPE